MDIKCIVLFINGSIAMQELDPLKDKSVLFSCYTPGETGLKTLDKAIELSLNALETLPGLLENHPVLIQVDANCVPAVVEAVGAAKNRHTLVVVVANDGVLFSGAGVTRDRSESERPVKAADILPTICYMSGLPLSCDSTGALLYQAMKDTNAPFTKIASLEASIQALEYTLERSKRQAWDKHDCA